MRTEIKIPVMVLNENCKDCPLMMLERIFDYKAPNHIRQECKNLDMCNYAVNYIVRGVKENE